MIDSPTVFIVDDDEGIRDSLGRLIKTMGVACRSFETALEFLESGAASLPGCAILDVRLPGMSGLELQAELNRRKLNIPVIFITGHGDMPIAVRAIKAGALDCFAKPFHAQDLLDRVNQAIRLDAQRRHACNMHDDIAVRAASLTNRERDVLDRVAVGKTSQMIATELGICKKTVDAQRACVMAKMKADSLADLVQMNLILKQRAESYEAHDPDSQYHQRFAIST